MPTPAPSNTPAAGVQLVVLLAASVSIVPVIVRSVIVIVRVPVLETMVEDVPLTPPSTRRSRSESGRVGRGP
jgi:hypothetical protein